MKESLDWAKKDFESGSDHLSDHEEEARSQTILRTGDGVTVVLPFGLPGLGIRLHGFIMLAPILLFMVLLLWFPAIVFRAEWESATTPVVVTAGCVVLFWALARVLQLMSKNRDLFPRRYFVTLGERGIAMHFSRLHFPAGRAKPAISWRDAASIETCSRVYFPAWFLGIPRVETLEVVSKDGAQVKIPFGRLKDRRVLDEVADLIRGKMKS